MTVQEHLERLQKDQASGKKLTQDVAQAEALKIINAAKKESLRHLVRLNKLFPLFDRSLKESKRIRETCNQCADLIRAMIEQDVIEG